MSGGGKCGSVENLPDDRIRDRVRFEAADGAASPQKGVQVNCVCQSGSAEF
jgi:hypothetical protein